MRKHTNTQNKRQWIPVIALILSTLSLFQAQAQDPEGNRWLNWVDYISYHPDYRQHQELQDIANQGAPWGTWVNFPNKIAAIAAKVKNWEDPTALFNSLDFVAIYKHPGYYYEHCLEYLADPQQPEQHKQIVIYALEQHGYQLARDCYKLYQKQQLSEALFRLVLGGFELLRIHPLVVQDNLSDFDKKRVTTFLHQIQDEVGAHTPIGLQADAILSGQLAKKWGRKSRSPLLHYRDKLPIAPTIRQAAKEYLKYKKYRQWLGNWKSLSEAELAPIRGQHQFLMLIEHVNCYIFLSSEDGDDVFFSFLKDPYTTNEEKRLFLFAMYRIGGTGEVKNTVHTYNPGVANLLDRTYSYYRTGDLALPLLEDLLHSPIPLDMGEAPYPRYPFFVSSYKSVHIQEGLDQFIASPTIPDGWKELAKRLKKGTLLTKQEINYLIGYQKFLGSHFILYETIPPQQ